MTNKPLILNSGAEEYNTDYQSGVGAEAPAIYVHSDPSETIDVLSRRMYGYDTPLSRDRLRKANNSLDGLVRIPQP